MKTEDVETISVSFKNFCCPVELKKDFLVAQSVRLHVQFRKPRSMPGSRRSPGEGNGNSLQYSCQGNPTDRGAWQATVHGGARTGHNLVTKAPPPEHKKRILAGMWK